MKPRFRVVALGFAHSQGIIHRDIKPANLLRDKSGVVKVADLGLARLNSTGAESSDDAESSTTSGLTQAGSVVGTAEYMAPEQAIDSHSADHRADVYALGATLYFLLAGTAPFTGKSVLVVLLKHRDNPIPLLRDRRPDVPQALDAVLQRMMAKNVADRYQSMADVVASLEGVATCLSATGASQPMAPAPPVAAAKANTPIAAESAKRKPLSVVIVEPSRALTGIIRKYLEAQGIVVAEAVGTGTATMAAMLDHQPDVIVSALHLEDTTGIELAKKIRAEFLDYVPGFVLISSEADGTDLSGLSRLDRVVVLPKPFSPEQLVQSLNLVTGKSVAVKSPDVSVPMTGLLQGLTLAAWKPRERSALRVLLVDDIATARVHVRHILQGLGFTQITEAADGAQAIAAATREDFDLIVTDYNMPLMDGHALISYLKQTPSTAAIPIVMVTTETSPATLDPVRKLGVVAVFDKTFPTAEVKAVIDKLFG